MQPDLNAVIVDPIMEVSTSSITFASYMFCFARRIIIKPQDVGTNDVLAIFALGKVI